MKSAVAPITTADPSLNPSSALDEIRAELRALGAATTPKTSRRGLSPFDLVSNGRVTLRGASARSDRSNMDDVASDVTWEGISSPTDGAYQQKRRIYAPSDSSSKSGFSATNHNSPSAHNPLLPRVGTRAALKLGATPFSGASSNAKGDGITNVFSQAMGTERIAFLNELKSLRSRHAAPVVLPPLASVAGQFPSFGLASSASTSVHLRDSTFETVRRNTESTNLHSRASSLAFSQVVECGTPSHGPRGDMGTLATYQARNDSFMTATSAQPPSPNDETRPSFSGLRLGFRRSRSPPLVANPATASYEAAKSELNALLLEEGLPRYEGRKEAASRSRSLLIEDGSEVGTQAHQSTSSQNTTPFQRNLSATVDELEGTMPGGFSLASESSAPATERRRPSPSGVGVGEEERLVLGVGIGKESGKAASAFKKRVEAKLTDLEASERVAGVRSLCLASGRVAAEDRLLPGRRLLGAGATENERLYELALRKEVDREMLVPQEPLGISQDATNAVSALVDAGSLLRDNIHTQAILRHRRQVVKQKRFVDEIRTKMHRHTAADEARAFVKEIFFGAFDKLLGNEQETMKEIEEAKEIFEMQTREQEERESQVAAAEELARRGPVVLSLAVSQRRDVAASSIARWWHQCAARLIVRSLMRSLAKYNQKRVLQELGHSQLLNNGSETATDTPGPETQPTAYATPTPVSSSVSTPTPEPEPEEDIFLLRVPCGELEGPAESPGHQITDQHCDDAGTPEDAGDSVSAVDETEALEALVEEQERQLRDIMLQIDREEVEEAAAISIERWVRKWMPRRQLVAAAAL